MVTELESDFLVCEVKWALGSITTNKASGDDGIPAELFKNLKDDAIKCYPQYIRNLKTSAVAIRLEKVISIPKEGNAKEYSDYQITCSFHKLASLCSKNFKLGFNSM